jgi:DnaK suppressor protein
MQEDTRVLERRLENLQVQIGKLERALGDKPDYGLGDGDPAITRWKMNYALLDQLQERKEHIEQTLSQAEGGTYGICVRCGQEIHPDRLAVLADARLCIRCARGETQEPPDLE